jgi:hypothetical protein
MRRLRIVVVIMGVATSAWGAIACENVANLDVGYRDAAVGEGGDANNGEAGPPPGNEAEGCPCDETQGLGCCVPKTGVPFCTTELTICNAEKGIFLKCLREDIASESLCCWHPSTAAAVSQTAYASSCDAGVAACIANGDCANDAGCTTTVCNGVTYGACGSTPPACP